MTTLTPGTVKTITINTDWTPGESFAMPQDRPYNVAWTLKWNGAQGSNGFALEVSNNDVNYSTLVAPGPTVLAGNQIVGTKFFRAYLYGSAGGGATISLSLLPA